MKNVAVLIITAALIVVITIVAARAPHWGPFRLLQRMCRASMSAADFYERCVMNLELPRVLLAGIRSPSLSGLVLASLQKAGHEISTCRRGDALHVLGHDPSIAATVTEDETLLHDLREHPRITRFRALPVVVVAEQASTSDKGRVSILPQARMVAHNELGELPGALSELLHPPWG